MRHYFLAFILFSIISCSKYVPLSYLDLADYQSTLDSLSESILVKYDNKRFNDKVEQEYFKSISFSKAKFIDIENSNDMWDNIFVKLKDPYLIALRDTFPSDFPEFWVYETKCKKIINDAAGICIESFYDSIKDRKIQLLFQIPKYHDKYWFIENNQIKIFYCDDIIFDTSGVTNTLIKGIHNEMDAKEFMETKGLNYQSSKPLIYK